MDDVLIPSQVSNLSICYLGKFIKKNVEHLKLNQNVGPLEKVFLFNYVHGQTSNENASMCKE